MFNSTTESTSTTSVKVKLRNFSISFAILISDERLDSKEKSCFFAKRLIKNITTESLNDYKLWRLSTNSKRLKTRPVKIFNVNHELLARRRIMRFAYGRGWSLKDIFFDAKVIDPSAEMERTQLLSPAEETRLLLMSCHYYCAR